MIGLYEGVMNDSESGCFFINYKFEKKIENEEILATQDKTTEEIKNILRKIQF